MLQNRWRAWLVAFSSAVQEMTMPLSTRLVTSILGILGVAFFGLAGCGPSRQAGEGQVGSSGSVARSRLRVVSTVGMVADLVREVGGAEVEVLQLMGSGVDPHLYQPTRDDVQQLMRADLVFYSGLMLEGKMADLFERLSSKRPVLAVTRGLSEQKLLREAEANEDIDPHVWMDIRLWRDSLEVVAQALAEYDPGRASLYRERAAGYDQRLQRLHAYGESVMASIPPERRVLVTSHDAFRYLGQAYGLEVLGIQGLSTESEAGLQQINRLVDLLVERRIQAVFVESSVSSKSIMSLVDGARSRDHQVAIGGELYSDAMGMVGTYEGTYEGMMDHNLTTITRGLGGTAPPRGYRDLLAAPRD